MKVIVKRCEEYNLDIIKQKISESLDALGGINSLIKPNDRVFIKCNCLGPFSPEQAITTHPIFLKAVIELVKEITPDITVGDNPAVKDLVFTMKKNGIYQVIQDEGVKILNNKDLVTIKNPSYKVYNEFEVSKGMVDTDVFINLPKLKTHSLAYITCAQKNLFGFVYGLNKSGWHIKASNPLEFGEAINDLYGAILDTFKEKSFINICDGIIGLEGEGPSTGGHPKKGNVILSSLDAVSLDRVAINVMGLDYSKSFITNIASKRGYGVGDIEKIEIIGDEIVNNHFLAPKDSLSNVGLRFLKFKPLRNIFLEHPTIDHSKCIKCGECTKICPPKTMQIKKGEYPHLTKSKCIRCWCCSEVCPQNAISKTKRPFLGKIIFKEKEKEKE